MEKQSMMYSYYSLTVQIVLVGRIISRVEEPMRTIFEINDNTSVSKVIFYQKGEGQIPTALKNFVYEYKPSIF